MHGNLEQDFSNVYSSPQWKITTQVVFCTKLCVQQHLSLQGTKNQTLLCTQGQEPVVYVLSSKANFQQNILHHAEKTCVRIVLT